MGGRAGGRVCAFSRTRCRTAAELKVAVEEAEGLPAESLAVIFNGAELSDGTLLAPLVPAMTGRERWVDQRVYPNGWSTTTLKHARQKSKHAAWGPCRTYQSEHVAISLLLCAIVMLVGSL